MSIVGESPPAPRRARRVTSAWSAEPAATVEDLKEFRKEARRLPEAGAVETGDLVVVVEPSRSWHGRVCQTEFADAGATLWLKKVEDVELSLSKLSAEICTLPKRGRETEPKALRRRDVVRLPWPGLRRPPPPMTEQHYMAQDWDKLSDKRFSPGRLSSTWDSMDAPSRRKYRGASVAAIEVYQQVAQWRLRMHALLKELLDVAPKPQVNAYMLYTMEKSKKPAEPLRPWQDVKEEYQKLVVRRNQQLREMRDLYIEVLLGAGWSQHRSHLFPRSASRCMLTLLMCSRNRLSAEGLRKVLELCSRCEKLRVLKLYKNDINDDGAQALSRFVRKCYTLEELHLSHNRFTERGVELLVRAAEEARTQAKSSVPLWTRLEQNEVKNPDKVLEYLTKEYSVCGRKHRDLCSTKHCHYGAKVLKAGHQRPRLPVPRAARPFATERKRIVSPQQRRHFVTTARMPRRGGQMLPTSTAIFCQLRRLHRADAGLTSVTRTSQTTSKIRHNPRPRLPGTLRETRRYLPLSSRAGQISQKTFTSRRPRHLQARMLRLKARKHLKTKVPPHIIEPLLFTVRWSYKSAKWWKNSHADDSKATSSAAAYDYGYGRKSQWRPAGESYGQAQGHQQTWWSAGGWHYEKPSYVPKGKGKGKAAGKGGGKSSKGGGGAGGSKCQCQYIIGIEEEGQHMKDIAEKTGAKLRLRGRGSKFLEGPEQKESSDPLMLCVSVPDPASYEEAKPVAQERHLVSSLLEDIYIQYREFQLSEGLKPKNLQVNLHEGDHALALKQLSLRLTAALTFSIIQPQAMASCDSASVAELYIEQVHLPHFHFQRDEFGHANNDGPRKRKWAPPPEPVEDTDPWKDTDWREGRDDWFDGCPEAFRKVPEWEEPARKKWRTEEEDWDGTGEPRPSGVKVVAVLPKTSPQPPPTPESRLPAVPSTFSELDNYSLSELQNLRANKPALDDLILEQTDVKALQKQLETARMENRSTAQSILSQESGTQSTSQDYASVSQALSATKASVEALSAQRDEILQKRSPEQLCVMLNGQAHTADAAAEDLLRDALEARQSLNASALAQFKQQFVQQKMEKHTRLALKSSLVGSKRFCVSNLRSAEVFKMSGGIFMRAMGAIVAKKDDDDGARPENEPSKPSRPPRVQNNVASRTLSQLGVLAGERRKAKVLLKEAPRGPVKKEDDLDDEDEDKDVEEEDVDEAEEASEAEKEAEEEEEMEDEEEEVAEPKRRGQEREEDDHYSSRRPPEPRGMHADRLDRRDERAARHHASPRRERREADGRGAGRDREMRRSP
ncbi:unnamed protein product [Symbiodinium sp. KB8]|nr:unnamed protein product [Symbiodinium sp. KB8]